MPDTKTPNLSPERLAWARAIATKAWEWPPANRDAAASVAEEMIPPLVDFVASVRAFTWDDVDVLHEAINEFKVKGIAPIDLRSAEFRETAAILQSLADRIAALLPPRNA